MIQIPKFIKDVTKYFQYETSPTPTTQDELQAFHKNQNSTLACLVDQLWQPETTYEINHQVFSPNMPKGFKATVKQAGITGSNEPDWGDGSIEIIDGSVTWKLSKGNITVNGNEPDQNGNITIPTYSPDFASDSEAIQGTSGTKIMTPKANNAVLGNVGYWQPSKSVTVNTVKFLKGEKYAGYYLKCTTGGTTGTTQPTITPPAINGVTNSISDGTVKWSMYGMLYALKLEGKSVSQILNLVPSISSSVLTVIGDVQLKKSSSASENLTGTIPLPSGFSRSNCKYWTPAFTWKASGSMASGGWKNIDQSTGTISLYSKKYEGAENLVLNYLLFAVK